MQSYKFSAQFITTEFENYIAKNKIEWNEIDKRFNQHKDLISWAGLPMFLKDFSIESNKNIKLYFSALGCVCIYINGVKLDIGELAPGWSDYNKRAFYYDIDISKFVKEGKNRIFAVISPGWYSGRISGGYYGNHSPAFACEIIGKNFNLTTDNSWLCNVGGQIRTADIWDGEFRDGNFDNYCEISKADYDVSNWKQSTIFDYKGEVSNFIGPKVNAKKVVDGKAMTPVSIKLESELKKTRYMFNEVIFENVNLNDNACISLPKNKRLVIDFGQELVGWVNLKIKGKVQNSTLKIRYAEFLNDSGSALRGNDGPKGTVYTINLRSALAKSYYKFGKNDIDNIIDYKPTFTFFGFRYIEITCDEDVEIYDIYAEVVGNDIEMIGKIETSNPLVNKLISNALWGQRSNYLYVPTDCPQRDERLGWTGDAQAFSNTAAYNGNVYEFFRKWMQDMRDSQSEDGGYGDVNPRVSFCDSQDASAWADAGVIIPWNMYTMYGDDTILKEHFDSMEKYVNGLITKYGYSGPIPRYGDWVAYDWCDNKFISSAYFVHDCDLMINICKVLGKEDKICHYEEMRKNAYDYFVKHFLRKGKPKENKQCNKIICLVFDLLSEEKAKETAIDLVEQIKKNGDRLSCGFLGTYNLCPSLSKSNQDNTAYNLLLQRNEPSWLYSVDQGATTIWERWNSYTLKKGFGDVSMNSFNHYAYGSIVEWMYRYMAGIQPLEPGFKKIKLAPCIDLRKKSELPEGQENITWVKASYKSSYGLIESEWDNTNGLVYKCKIPTEAEVYLPFNSKSITVNGTKIKAEIVNGKSKILLGAGEYIITK